MSTQVRLLLVAGVVLDTLGVALLVFSLVQEADFLWFGLALMVVGSLMIVRWARILSPPEEGRRERTAEEALKDWTPEPELAAPLPRQVRLSPVGRWRTVLWALALSAALMYTTALPRRTTLEEEALQKHGLETVGAIHGKEARPRSSGGTTYYLYYNFKDRDGKGFRASIAVDEQTYRSAEEGDSVEVIYLPEDPLFHQVRGLGGKSGPGLERFVWVEALAVAFVALEVQRRRHKRLTMYGKAVPGIVKKLTRLGASSAYTVECTPGGRRRTLRGSERRPGIQPGDVVTVLYMPDKPREVVLYRLSLYRVVN